MNKLFVGLSILFTYLLMVMGNIVTTTGSGLACPDWPLCYGSVVPPLQINIWFEWGHRLLGGLTGLFILASTVLVWRSAAGPERYLTASALGLLGVGAVFGGIIVLIEAPMLKGALHLLVISFHIILATIIFTLLILALRLIPGRGEPGGGGVYPVLFAAVFAQVIIGVFVRYGQATLACPDFPLCRGLILPELVDFKVTIHFIHRLMALGVFIIVAGYFAQAVTARIDLANASVTLALVLIQATLGVYIVWSGMFLPYVVLHGANGFALLGWLAYRSAPFFMPKQAPERAPA